MCKHQFVLIEQVFKPKKTTNTSTTVDVVLPIRDVYGAKVGCPLCGDVRTIFTDGTVVIDIKGNG